MTIGVPLGHCQSIEDWRRKKWRRVFFVHWRPSLISWYGRLWEPISRCMDLKVLVMKTANSNDFSQIMHHCYINPFILTWTRGIGDLALGVASTSLSSANMSAPLFGVLKIEPDVMLPRGVLQKKISQKQLGWLLRENREDFSWPVVRGGRVAVELELSRQVESAVEQLVRRVRAETINSIASIFLWIWVSRILSLM